MRDRLAMLWITPAAWICALVLLATCAVRGHRWRDVRPIDDGEYAYVECTRCGHAPDEPMVYR